MSSNEPNFDKNAKRGCLIAVVILAAVFAVGALSQHLGLVWR